MTTPRRRDALVAPLAASAALLVPGVLALATRQLFLFASLGPTSVMLAHEPAHRSSRPYAVLVGHLVGLASACGTVATLGLAHAPSVFVLHAVSGVRVSAAVIALGVATALEIVLHAQHPPAASTTLLVALGSFHPTWHDAGLVIGGVVAVAAGGELVRWLRLHGDAARDAGRQARATA